MPLLAIFQFIGVRGVIALALAAALGLCYVGYKVEKYAKEKAQAALATKTTANEIMQEQIKLYQEREEIKATATKRRGNLNALQQKNDLDGLADDFNSPGGVRHALPANPQGGVKAPARYKDAGGTGPEYEEAH
jgi:hypothetical protein